MYAQRELNRLGEVKASLQRRIGRRRVECAVQADTALRPLQWVDRAYGYWRRIAPIAKLAMGPLGVWLFRSVARRRKVTGSLLRFAPLLWNVFRGFSRGRAA